MKSFVSAVTLVLVATTTTAQAQAGGTARVTPYVGFLASGSIANGPLGTRLAVAGSPTYGVQLGLPVTSYIALVGNLGYSAGQLEAGVPFLGGIGIADSKVLMYDGGVQLRLPSTTSIVPFVEGGVGAMRHEITVGPLTTQSTNVAFIAGGGVDLQLTDALGVRLMARDHMSRFDYGEALGISSEGRRAHNWVVGVGLSLGR